MSDEGRGTRHEARGTSLWLITHRSSLVTRLRIGSLAVLVGGLALLLVGCGSDEYKSRLARTVGYFEYLDELNQNLSQTKWKQAGIEFRVPKQFKPVAIPEPVAANPEEPIQPDEPAVSPRPSDGDAEPGRSRAPAGEEEPGRLQPSDEIPLGQLPGLVGAWEAQVGVEGQDGNRPAYLFVLSNYDLWLLKDAGESALNFQESAVFELTSVLGIAPPADNEWTDETLPHGKAFVDKQQFQVSKPLTANLHGLKYDVMIYRHTVKDIQVVIAFVIPQNWSRGEDLDERIQLSLETLSVSGEKPTEEEGEPRTQQRGSGF